MTSRTDPAVVTLADIRAIQAVAKGEANADQPVGLLTDPVRDALLRVEGRVRDPRQFEALVVARRGNLALTLGDLGQLVEREREPDSTARINGQRAISIEITKNQDANVVVVGNGIKKVVTDLKATLPADADRWIEGTET